MSSISVLVSEVELKLSVIRRLAAICYPPACCKLLSAGLLQVVQAICSKRVDNKS